MASISHRKLAHHFKQGPKNLIFLFLHFALDMPLCQRIYHKCLGEFTNARVARLPTPTAKPGSISRANTAFCLKRRGNLQQMWFFNTAC